MWYIIFMYGSVTYYMGVTNITFSYNLPYIYPFMPWSSHYSIYAISQYSHHYPPPHGVWWGSTKTVAKPAGECEDQWSVGNTKSCLLPVYHWGQILYETEIVVMGGCKIQISWWVRDWEERLNLFPISPSLRSHPWESYWWFRAVSRVSQGCLNCVTQY